MKEYYARPNQTKSNQIKSNQTIVILTGCHLTAPRLTDKLGLLNKESPTDKRGRFNKLFNQLSNACYGGRGFVWMNTLQDSKWSKPNKRQSLHFLSL